MKPSLPMPLTPALPPLPLRLSRIARWLASPRLFCHLCLWTMVLLVAGTLAQRWIGLLEAQRQFFESWILWCGFVPLPGMRLTLAALSLTMLLRLLQSPLERQRAGIWLTHLGALMLTAGGTLAGLDRLEGYLLIPEGTRSAVIRAYDEQSNEAMRPLTPRILAELPFSLELRRVEKLNYPGSDEARDYRSDVIIDDHGLKLPVTLRMNEPLRYKGYSFYQSSYMEAEQGKATVLAVKKHGAWLYPYIATATLAAGLMLHLFQRTRSGAP